LSVTWTYIILLKPNVKSKLKKIKNCQFQGFSGGPVKSSLPGFKLAQEIAGHERSLFQILITLSLSSLVSGQYYHNHG
jgi:hypothetical protein